MIIDLLFSLIQNVWSKYKQWKIKIMKLYTSENRTDCIFLGFHFCFVSFWSLSLSGYHPKAGKNLHSFGICFQCFKLHVASKKPYNWQLLLFWMKHLRGKCVSFYWSIIAFQCCISSCWPLNRISYTYAYIPSLDLPPTPIPLHPSRSSQRI